MVNMGKIFSIGIMQGRLTSPKGRGIQFFPFEEWDKEFGEAAKLGLNEIEFIFDLDRYQENPLWSEAGVHKIKNLIATSGVKVSNICADFFMRRPFFRSDESVRKENVEVLKKLIEQAADIGAKNVEMPLLDNSSLKTEEEEEILVRSVTECLPTAQNHNVILSLEMDLPPVRFKNLLEKFTNRQVKAVYDSGNSSGLGYDHYEEVTTLGDFMLNIHIKDRILGGGTVPLGTGSADFNKLFSGLGKIDYRGGFILQAARGEDGEEEKTVRSQMEFLKNYL